MASSPFCPGPMSRRSFLQVGSLAASGLALGDMFRLRAQANLAVEPDTSVIFVWMPGGPPHIDTYDLKPNAPEEYRGPFKPIRTNVPGIEISELFPRQAKIADKYALIRSIGHDFFDHGGGHKRLMTGRVPATPTGTENDAPAVTAIVHKKRFKPNSDLPTCVVGADNGRTGIDVFAFGSAYLGHSSNPFIFGGNPSEPGFKVQNLSLNTALADKLDDRLRLMHGFDDMRRNIDRAGIASSMDEFDRRALRLMTSTRARDAFDLSREPDALRERYGRHSWGQRALMARRLVEAGCSFVSMVFENPTPGKELPKDTTYNWDSHAVNCHIFTDTTFRAPYLDQAVTALIEDIYQRGLDRKVLLVFTGEFGRTPKIEHFNGRPGRDHWAPAMSVMVSGGGMPTGQVVGSTTSKGERPKDRPLTPNDLWATVYRHLGINTDDTFNDHLGRPMAILPFGKPIEELLPA